VGTNSTQSEISIRRGRNLRAREVLNGSTESRLSEGVPDAPWAFSGFLPGAPSFGQGLSHADWDVKLFAVPCMAAARGAARTERTSGSPALSVRTLTSPPSHIWLCAVLASLALGWGRFIILSQL